MMTHAAEARRWVVPEAARLADQECKAGPGGQLLAGQRLVLAAHSGAPPADTLLLSRSVGQSVWPFHSRMQHILDIICQLPCDAAMSLTILLL